MRVPRQVSRKGEGEKRALELLRGTKNSRVQKPHKKSVTEPKESCLLFFGGVYTYPEREFLNLSSSNFGIRPIKRRFYQNAGIIFHWKKDRDLFHCQGVR